MNEFPKTYRLLTKNDFSQMRSGAAVYNTESLRVFHKNNDLGFSRLGLAISKKAGNAVTRNIYKRLIREYFRKNTNTTGKDFLFTFNSRCKSPSSLKAISLKEKLNNELRTVFNSI